MAKGQKRSNKEVRKPKADTVKKGAEPTTSAAISTMFGKPGKADGKPKRK
jgi:hypothetical protein